MKSIQEIKLESAVSDLIIERFSDLVTINFSDLTGLAGALASDIVNLIIK